MEVLKIINPNYFKIIKILEKSKKTAKDVGIEINLSRFYIMKQIPFIKNIVSLWNQELIGSTKGYILRNKDILN